MSSEDVVGLVLAAGAGTRAGGPKALRADDGEPWVAHAVRVLRAGGCADVLVVLGAQAERAAALVPPVARVVVAADWADGLSASLRAGLAAAGRTDAVAAAVSLVDLPALPAAVVARVLGRGVDADVLRRAVFAGTPGHPLLLGRAHWAAVAAAARGDRGAGPYLRGREVDEVECGDLWDGADVDA